MVTYVNETKDLALRNNTNIIHLVTNKTNPLTERVTR